MQLCDQSTTFRNPASKKEWFDTMPSWNLSKESINCVQSKLTSANYAFEKLSLVSLLCLKFNSSKKPKNKPFFMIFDPQLIWIKSTNAFCKNTVLDHFIIVNILFP